MIQIRAAMRKTTREEIPVWLARSRDADPKMRRQAVHALCPCETKVHDRRAWQRMIAMVDDPDAGVRGSICHVLCDGSPAEYEAEVVACLDKLGRDADLGVRKQARRVLAGYRRTGRLNVL
jgi:hypothetical protein